MVRPSERLCQKQWSLLVSQFKARLRMLGQGMAPAPVPHGQKESGEAQASPLILPWPAGCRRSAMEAGHARGVPLGHAARPGVGYAIHHRANMEGHAPRGAHASRVVMN